MFNDLQQAIKKPTVITDEESILFLYSISEQWHPKHTDKLKTLLTGFATQGQNMSSMNSLPYAKPEFVKTTRNQLAHIKLPIQLTFGHPQMINALHFIEVTTDFTDFISTLQRKTVTLVSAAELRVQ